MLRRGDGVAGIRGQGGFEVREYSIEKLKCGCRCRVGSLASLGAAYAALGYHDPVVNRNGIWYIAGKHGAAVSNGDEGHVQRIISKNIETMQCCEHGKKHVLPIWC
jgi:hypothetical protein